MTRLLSLEDFDRPRPAQDAARPAAPAAAAGPPAIDLEEERLQAFEKGYRAGWDDAAAAHSGEQSRISAELGQNLQDMSFTYHEAYAALSREIGEVMRGLVGKVLPGALGAALSETVQARAEAILEQNRVPVEIVVAPQNAPRLAALLEGQPAPPIRIVEEPSLGEGQAYLRFGAAEEKVDVAAVLDELAEVVDRFGEADGEAGGEHAATGLREMRHG